VKALEDQIAPRLKRFVEMDPPHNKAYQSMVQELLATQENLKSEAVEAKQEALRCLIRLSEFRKRDLARLEKANNASAELEKFRMLLFKAQFEDAEKRRLDTYFALADISMGDKRASSAILPLIKHIRREVAKEKDLEKIEKEITRVQERIRVMYVRQARRDKLWFERHPAFVDSKSGKVCSVVLLQILRLADWEA